jgi:hypothetical protein
MAADPRAAASSAGTVLVVDDLESNLPSLEQLLKARPDREALPTSAAIARLQEEVRLGWPRKDLVDAFISTRAR